MGMGSLRPATETRRATIRLMSETIQAVRFHEHGGPEVFRVEELPLPELGPEPGPEPGQGEALVRVAIDGVGRATFEGSIAATRVRGHVILFGQASGAPDPIDVRKVLGSRTLTAGSLYAYSSDRDEMLERARRVFGWYADGRLEVHVDRVLPLSEAAEAHRLLEGRKTSGKLLLQP